jgi:hypothetical protein
MIVEGRIGGPYQANGPGCSRIDVLLHFHPFVLRPGEQATGTRKNVQDKHPLERPERRTPAGHTVQHSLPEVLPQLAAAQRGVIRLAVAESAFNDEIGLVIVECGIRHAPAESIGLTQLLIDQASQNADKHESRDGIGREWQQWEWDS